MQDQRTINIGGAALLSAIRAVTGEEKTSLQEKLVQLGDPGDVASLSFRNNPRGDRVSPTLTLSQLSERLEQLATCTCWLILIQAQNNALSISRG